MSALLGSFSVLSKDTSPCSLGIEPGYMNCFFRCVCLRVLAWKPLAFSTSLTVQTETLVAVVTKLLQVFCSHLKVFLHLSPHRNLVAAFDSCSISCVEFNFNLFLNDLITANS